MTIPATSNESWGFYGAMGRHAPAAWPLVSVHEASERIGVDRKNLYLRVNTETRAIADRYLRHRAAAGEQRKALLHTQIGDILDERLAAGYVGMSARDIWNRLNTEAQSVPGIFRLISEVVSSRRN